MCKCYTFLLALFLSFLAENLAVNSPQMTFFTPASHEAVIHLESKYGNSATLKLARPKDVTPTTSANVYSNVNQTREGKISEFLILGPDYPLHGVSAIIQEVNLRPGQDNIGCRDYVQFSVNTSETEKANKICGKISPEENWNDKNITDPRLQRSFFSPSGIIHLYFHADSLDYDDETLDISPVDDSQPITDVTGRDIGIQIVFTSYTVCPNPANSWKKLRPCSNREKMSCIYSTLYCDNKVDCGFPGEFGIDEEGCYVSYIYMFVSIFGGIFLTASLIYIFVRWVTTVPKEYQ